MYNILETLKTKGECLMAETRLKMGIMKNEELAATLSS